MADIAIFRINYKSDFILTLNSDAGWMTPFCIKFWTGAPSQAYFAGYDGTTYTHCAPVEGEPTKLLVQFDDHHLPIGDLKFQIAYHFTVADFPTSVEDEVINQASVIIDVDDAPAQVMLDLNGETAPEIQFSLPAYANEAQRIANEEERINNEEARIAAEDTRQQNEQQRISREQQRINQEQQRVNSESERVSEFSELKTESEAATAAANSAAILANEKAEYADIQGDYAKTQGDYAKAQGDTAEEDHQRAEADHGIAVDDHTQAGTDHQTAAADHTQAGNDHTRAESDHTRAESDHAAVDVYVDSLGVFDLSKHNAVGGVLATYADISAALTALNALESKYKYGGMSIKFVQSSDNKYVQYRYMLSSTTNTNFANVANWQGVDEEPTAGSHNLIESRGVPPIKVEEQIMGDLAFADLLGNYLLLITDHIKTKSFDSKDVLEKIQQIFETLSSIPQFANSDLFDSGIADENLNVLFALCEGHLKTKNFDSKEAVEKIQQIFGALATIQRELDEWEDIIENLPQVPQYKDQSETSEYVTVLSDDFDNQSSVWSESWNRQNGTFTPQNLNQVAKTSKRFFSDKRQIRIKTTLYNDVVLQIYSTNAQEASTYTIDLVNKKITLGTEEFSIQDLSITNGAVHEIVISLQNFVTKVSIYNTKTNGIQEVQMFGRQCYELKGHFCMKQTQGTLISLSDFSISILKNPTILFLGDSITAGAYFRSTDEANAMYVYHMYTKLIGNDIENCMSVSAGGGGITEFTEMWTNEISYTQPKAISALVGTNGGFTLQQITTLMSNLLTVTTKLFVHHLFGTNSTYHLADYNQILEQALTQQEFSGVKSARLDIATSTQKSENTAENVTLDTSLMYDRVIHPNYDGSKAIVNRIKFDCPELFRLN